MARALYRFINGEFVEVYSDQDREAPKAPVIHNDTMDALRNPVTGTIHDSKSSYLKECDRLGLEVVGTEKFSQKGNALKDKLTDAVILDRIEKAEAILSDPAKRRERQYRNERLLELRERLLGNG